MNCSFARASHEIIRSNMPSIEDSCGTIAVGSAAAQLVDTPGNQAPAEIYAGIPRVLG
jgi:hypothetical protein